MINQMINSEINLSEKKKNSKILNIWNDNKYI